MCMKLWENHEGKIQPQRPAGRADNIMLCHVSSLPRICSLACPSASHLRIGLQQQMRYLYCTRSRQLLHTATYTCNRQLVCSSRRLQTLSPFCMPAASQHNCMNSSQTVPTLYYIITHYIIIHDIIIHYIVIIHSITLHYNYALTGAMR